MHRGDFHGKISCSYSVVMVTCLIRIIYEMWFTFQKIYVALEEADSVAGVAAIRITEPQLSEQILQYECTGMYM